MKNEHITHLIPEYLEGFLTNDQKADVKQHLNDCPNCAKELEEYETMLHAFDSEMTEAPNKTLWEGFHKLLDEEKRMSSESFQSKTIHKKTPINWTLKALKIAAGIALLVGSYFFGSYQTAIETNKEIAMLKEKNLGIRQTAMLSLMENKSASKRIQGVNYVEEFSKPDDDILKALTERMLNDENANVRLTAVNALAGFANSKTAREALIKTLKSEKDPNIQITLIHTLVKLQEKKAVYPMKQLLDQKDTEPFVKEQIKSLLPSII
ncbi:putative zinc finger protein [Gillisia sp. Hel_I_86]|uniref:HEAT repeat domain-containing protein n=1 Tax=Gillisia sp. Hel_I_86 TaxID=1249981 RepID=UPI00119BF0C1|nr:HEAT repeat domain-containing protein [Gillisia sp. Hel_I_86]TVZ25823.1 putative zinc finger protein [Gillisia sp. Hel_I_86]